MYLNRDNIRGGYKHPKFNDDLRDCKGCIGKQRKCMLFAGTIYEADISILAFNNYHAKEEV
jgi:hypothetical protein